MHGQTLPLGEKDNALSRKLGIAGRPVILTFGRMSADERYKGFDEVIQVLPRLLLRVPNLVYVAAGDGSDRARLEAKAKALGVGDHVRFWRARQRSGESGSLSTKRRIRHAQLGRGFRLRCS